MEYLFGGWEGCLWKVFGFVGVIILIAQGPIGWGILLFLVIILLIVRLIIVFKSPRSSPSIARNLLSETSSPPPDQEAFSPVSEEVEAVDNAIRDVLQEINNDENRKPVVSSAVTSSVNVPDDLDNILRDISQGKIKDAVTQGRFRPRDKVYLCLAHRLAYHEDTWQGIGYKCEVCGHGRKTKLYTLPPADELPENQTSPQDSEIKVYISEESIDF